MVIDRGHEHRVPPDDARDRGNTRHRCSVHPVGWALARCPRQHRRGRGLYAPRSPAKVISSGILINLLNPKLTIFFFAFLPQFVTHQSHATLRMLGLSAVFMLITFVVFVVYGVFAAAVRDQVISRPRVMVWVRRIFGGAFAMLAGRLAFTER